MLAVATLEWPLLGVASQVFLQSVWPQEGLAAELTRVRSVTRVAPAMVHKGVPCRKSLATRLTLMHLLVLQLINVVALLMGP